MSPELIASMNAALAKVAQTGKGCVIVVHPDGENFASHDLGAVGMEEHAFVLGTAGSLLQGLGDCLVESLGNHAGLSKAQIAQCQATFGGLCYRAMKERQEDGQSTGVELREPERRGE